MDESSTSTQQSLSIFPATAFSSPQTTYFSLTKAQVILTAHHTTDNNGLKSNKNEEIIALTSIKLTYPTNDQQQENEKYKF